MATKEATVAEGDVAATGGGTNAWRWGLAVGLAVLIILQVVLLVAVVRSDDRISDDLAALQDDVTALQSQSSALVLGADEVPDLGTSPGAAVNQSPAPAGGPGSTDPGGDLPRFQATGNDPALGRTLAPLAALEYYSGENAAVDPSDGVARAYMVWAHWCPFCQEELPDVAEWQQTTADSFDNFELVSVTTAMDAGAANPLVPYLDQSQFPFPVLVDDDGSLSRQMGVNAFPFWVFTAPDGRVVGRAAGALEVADLTTVIEELVTLSPTA